LPNWKEKLTAYTAAPSSFEIKADILQLYAYATEDWQRQSFGRILASYVRILVEALREYTDSGKDHDAVTCFGMVIEKYQIVIEADPKVSICGLDTKEGTLRIIFHPNNFGTNVPEMCPLLTLLVDSRESPIFEYFVDSS
jgi:hypothetical protein